MPIAKAKKPIKKKVVSKKTHSKPEVALKQPKVERYVEAVGRRKTSVARVRLWPNKSDIIINEKNYKQYFPYQSWHHIIEEPFRQLQPSEKVGVTVKVSGGGIHSQAEAVRHGLSRALIKLNEDYHKRLKKLGFLTRDPRMKERRKYGLKKARRAPQWSKR